MQKKKMMVIVGIVIALLVIAGVASGVYMMTRKPEQKEEEVKTEQPEKRRRRANQFDTIPLEDRPYVYVKPLASGHDISILISGIKKTASKVEYELEYQTGEQIQAAFGEVDITGSSVSKEVLMGTRSAGGATTYHENVKGGTIVTRFSGDDAYAFKSDWNFIVNSSRAKVVTTKDKKFELDSAEVAKQRLIVVTNSPGYMSELPGTPVSPIYVVATPGTMTGTGKISITPTETVAGAEIAVWDGSSWTAVDAEVVGEVVTATVDLSEAYVVVK